MFLYCHSEDIWRGPNLSHLWTWMSFTTYLRQNKKIKIEFQAFEYHKSVPTRYSLSFFQICRLKLSFKLLTRHSVAISDECYYFLLPPTKCSVAGLRSAVVWWFKISGRAKRYVHLKSRSPRVDASNFSLISAIYSVNPVKIILLIHTA